MDALTRLLIRARQWRVSNTRRKQTPGDLRVQPDFSAAPGIDGLNGGPGLDLRIRGGDGHDDRYGHFGPVDHYRPGPYRKTRHVKRLVNRRQNSKKGKH
jgi:hypothetical protein